MQFLRESPLIQNNTTIDQEVPRGAGLGLHRDDLFSTQWLMEDVPGSDPVSPALLAATPPVAAAPPQEVKLQRSGSVRHCSFESDLNDVI